MRGKTKGMTHRDILLMEKGMELGEDSLELSVSGIRDETSAEKIMARPVHPATQDCTG